MKIGRIFKLSSLIIVVSLLVIGCGKDPNEPDEETPGTSQVKFTWSVNGGSTITASDGYYIFSYNEIIATKAGSTAIDIILDDLTKGTHNISPSNGITLEYYDGSATFDGKSGTVTISENTGTSLSGSFTCVLNGGTTTIAGQFSNLPKK